MRHVFAIIGLSASALFATSAHAETTTGSDHSTVVGHLGVGWFGVSSVPNGLGTGGISTVSAPVIGARYWMSPDLGIDLGLGLAIGSSSSTTESGGTSNTTDGPSTFGFMLHGGVPIALYSGKHYTFLVTPELNFGYGHTSQGDDSGSGIRLELGARGGAEIQFGFIGVPELSLEASVGFFLTYLRGSFDNGNTTTSASSLSIATSSFNNPWDFFSSSVAARYYF